MRATPRAIVGWALLLGSLVAAPAGAQGATPVVPAQELATLYGAHPAHRRPAAASPVTAVVAAVRPITYARTTLPVLGRARDAGGHAWLRVRLPGRALGQTAPPPAAWIRAAGTLRMTTPWHLVVRLGQRSVAVYRQGRLVRRFPAIVGKPSTPTPRGAFFVEESVRLSQGQAGAPFALATSARSAVLQEFDGGPGQIALHGRGGVGGVLGTAVSHGCVRLDDGAITWLARRIGPGVPVTVR